MRWISYSQYAMWEDCKHHWKLEYFDELKDREDSVHTIFGKAMHDTVQTYVSERFANPYIETAHVNDQFKNNLITKLKEATKVLENGEKEFVCDRETAMDFYVDGVKILTDLLEEQRAYDLFFDPRDSWDDAKVEIELPLEVPIITDVLGFRGFLDFTISGVNPRKVLIYDLKTSTRGWFYEKRSAKKIAQLLLYKNFYSIQNDIPLDDITVQFIIVARKPSIPSRIDVFTPRQDADTIKQVESKFLAFLDETFDMETGAVKVDNLVPNPSANNCKFCPFKNRKDLCSVGIE